MELLIVVVLMALLASVATVAIGPSRQRRTMSPSDMVGDSLRASSADARSRLVSANDSFSAFVLPDGRVVADSLFQVDVFTGRPAHAR